MLSYNYTTYPSVSPAPVSMHPKALSLYAYHSVQLKNRSTNTIAGLKLHKECLGVLIKKLTELAGESSFHS